MLKNELELLSKWITGRTEHPLLRKESKRIRESWTGVLLGGSKEEVIRRYFCYQQQVLLEIADDLNDVHNPELLNCVLELHDFLLRYFKPYTDPEAKIPSAFVSVIRKRAKAAAEKVRTGLEKTSVDPVVKAAVLDYLTAEQPGITYQQENYFHAFCDALKQDIDGQQQFGEVLCMLNFNHYGFCRWYQKQLEQQGVHLQASERVVLMKKQLVMIKAMPVRTGMAYDRKLPSVSMQTERWLTAMIQQETEDTQKLALNITVAQLALLIRSLFEAGFFATQNIGEVLRFP